MTTQPVVVVQDAFGNTVTTNTSSVTLALTTPGGALLTCTTDPVAATAGVATFAGCKVDKKGTYTLTATDGVLSPGTSSSFTMAAGAPSQLRYVTDGTGSIASCPTGSLTGLGNGGSLSMYVAILDAFGNLTVAPATATTITLTRTPTAGGNAPTPATLPVLANASPAVTSGSSLFKLSMGNPPPPPTRPRPGRCRPPASSRSDRSAPPTVPGSSGTPLLPVWFCRACRRPGRLRR